MPVFAKIDENGDVLEFPYRVLDMRRMPADAVLCNSQVKKPTNVKWYEGLWYERVEREGDEYVVYYIKKPKKFFSEDEKKNTLKTLIAQAINDSERALSEQKITFEQHNANLEVLHTIDVDDESTYDNYHNIKS